MQLSARARYAVRIMARICTDHDNGPVRKQDIADREGLSADYIEQILVGLRNASLVNSHRGARGGFSLARDPGSITVADILRAVEGPFSLAPESEGDDAPTRSMWTGASQLLEKYFSGITLQDVVRKMREHDRKAITYHI